MGYTDYEKCEEVIRNYKQMRTRNHLLQMMNYTICNWAFISPGKLENKASLHLLRPDFLEIGKTAMMIGLCTELNIKADLDPKILNQIDTVEDFADYIEQLERGLNEYAL